MAFNINGIDLKKFNVNIGGNTHKVKRFDVVKDGVTTTVWKDILDIFPNSDITWTVELNPASDAYGLDKATGTFKVGRGTTDKSRTGYCRSSAIDVSDYKTLIWKGECSSGKGSGAMIYGHTWAYLYGGTSEGAYDVFKIILGEDVWQGVNKTFDETIDITDIDTLYLTVEITFASTNDQGGWQAISTESIIAKNE